MAQMSTNACACRGCVFSLEVWGRSTAPSECQVLLYAYRCGSACRRLRRLLKRKRCFHLPSSTGEEFALPEPTLEWLLQMQKGKAKAKAQTASLAENEQLQLQYMGKHGPNEFLLRLAKDSSADTPIDFSSELGLTTREGEVLSWLSKGKTNRDIAQILGLSPQTVDKHLE
jgi:DNA-binding CsgD family transcriptional regulator